MDVRTARELAIADYALIGDGVTAALVARDGAIDWLCYGRFDGPAVFCRLLDAQKGGYLQVAPSSLFVAARRYLGRTNVLQTEFDTFSGKLRVTDFMPLRTGNRPMILRKVEGLAGDVPVKIDFAATFDFARAQTLVEWLPDGCYAEASGAGLRLLCPGRVSRTDRGVTSSFELAAGETRWVVLTHGDPPPADAEAEELLRQTLRDWERWASHGHFLGPYADRLCRSALALKLLIHRPSGGMVAAPTTSLPESPGGERNWDYRFTWLRDASWLVSALMTLGYHDESMAFIDWLEALDLGKGRPSIFYDLDGRAPVDEQLLSHLHGYGGARPVRTGNAAATQDQHDVYGEVVAAIHMCSEGMPSMRPLRPGLWKLVSAMAEGATLHWSHEDHGMWEQRHPPKHYLASKLLCWVALDRALAIAARDRLAGPLKRWARERTWLRNAILRHGFDEGLGCFTRAFGSGELDATALLLPRDAFLSANDPRMIGTVARVREGLSAGDGLLRRYVVPDGLPGSEGAFVACSFWLVDCLARQGRVDEARQLFESVASRASDVGLLSEEIWPSTGELLGNYPQAFSHLALIRAAATLAEAEGKLRRGLTPSRQRVTAGAGRGAARPRREERRLMRVARGLLANLGPGLASTAAMSAVMLAAHEAGVLGETPPRLITKRTLRRMGLRTSSQTEALASAGLHFGYGVLGAALFRSLTKRTGIAPTPGRGAAFGALVWAASYFGWVPALGLMPLPGGDRPGRPVFMLLAHLVFGAALGAMHGKQARGELR